MMAANPKRRTPCKNHAINRLLMSQARACCYRYSCLIPELQGLWQQLLQQRADHRLEQLWLLQALRHWLPLELPSLAEALFLLLLLPMV